MNKTVLYMVLCISGISLSCSGGSSTDVSGNWKKPGYTGKKFNDILVLAISDDLIKRSNVENAVVKKFTEYNIKSAASTNVLDYSSLEVNKGKLDTNKIEEIKKKLQSLGYDGVIVISLLDVKQKTEYVPGQSYYGSYYHAGFYNYWYGTYSVVNSPGYYVNKTSVYLETRLFDPATEDLLWAAQTESSDVKEMKDFSASFAEAITAKIIKDKAVK